MPKMGIKKQVISMTRSEDWTSLWIGTRTDKIKSFCIDHCPHPDIPCKGDCQERRDFVKVTKKRRAERV